MECTLLTTCYNQQENPTLKSAIGTGHLLLSKCNSMTNTDINLELKNKSEKYEFKSNNVN